MSRRNFKPNVKLTWFLLVWTPSLRAQSCWSLLLSCWCLCGPIQQRSCDNHCLSVGPWQHFWSPSWISFLYGGSFFLYLPPESFCLFNKRTKNIAYQISSPSIPYHYDLLAVLIKEVKMVAVLLAFPGESFNLNTFNDTTPTWEIIWSMAQKVFWYQKEFALVSVHTSWNKLNSHHLQQPRERAKRQEGQHRKTFLEN